MARKVWTHRLVSLGLSGLELNEFLSAIFHPFLCRSSLPSFQIGTPQKGSFRRGKSAINPSIEGNFAEFDPGLFIYVRPVGGLENYLC